VHIQVTGKSHPGKSPSVKGTTQRVGDFVWADVTMGLFGAAWRLNGIPPAPFTEGGGKGESLPRGKSPLVKGTAQRAGDFAQHDAEIQVFS